MKGDCASNNLREYSAAKRHGIRNKGHFFIFPETMGTVCRKNHAFIPAFRTFVLCDKTGYLHFPRKEKPAGLLL